MERGAKRAEDSVSVIKRTGYGSSVCSTIEIDACPELPSVPVPSIRYCASMILCAMETGDRICIVWSQGRGEVLSVMVPSSCPMCKLFVCRDGGESGRERSFFILVCHLVKCVATQYRYPVTIRAIAECHRSCSVVFSPSFLNFSPHPKSRSYFSATTLPPSRRGGVAPLATIIHTATANKKKVRHPVFLHHHHPIPIKRTNQPT